MVQLVAKGVPLPDCWGLSPAFLAQIDVVTGRVAYRYSAHLASLSAYLSNSIFLGYVNALNHQLYCDRKALIKLVNLGGRNLALKDMWSARVEIQLVKLIFTAKGLIKLVDARSITVSPVILAIVMDTDGIRC